MKKVGMKIKIITKFRGSNIEMLTSYIMKLSFHSYLFFGISHNKLSQNKAFF